MPNIIPDPNATPGITAVKPVATAPAPVGNDVLDYAALAKTYNFPNYSNTPGQNAAITAMYNNGGPQVNNKTITGSSSVQVGQNTSTAVGAASSALTKPQPVPAYGAPVYGPDGKQVGTAQFDPNTGKPLQNPATQAPTVNPDGSYTLPSGAVVNTDGTIKTPAPGGNTTTTPTAPTIVSQTAPDSSGGYTATYSNGTTAYVPASPAVSGLYAGANTATSQETTSYNNQVNDATTAYNQQLQQLQEQMQNATTAAEASYDTNNPEGSGSDKSEYSSSVAKPFLEAIANLNADHQNNLTDMASSHTANLQNIQTQLQSGVQTYNSNVYSAGTDTLKELEKGDGTISDDDRATLIQQLTTGGTLSPDQANLEIDSALQQANTAQNKTLTAEQQKGQTLAQSSFKSMIANSDDVQSLSQDPLAISTGLATGLAGNPVGFDANGDPAYTDAQRNEVSQYILTQNKQSTAAALAAQKEVDNVTFKNASLNERYAALAQSGQTQDLGHLLTAFSDIDTSQLSSSDKAGFSTALQSAGLPEAMAESLVNTGSVKTQPVTTETGQTGLTGQVLPPVKKVEKKGNPSTGSSSVSIGGQSYSAGQKISNGSVTLTVNSDGTLSGSDGHTYDQSGNVIK